MKEIELKLAAELIRNSRRSDRDLAKAIGASQPTVTRIRNKLENEGFFKEYTIIPDFTKLGYHLLVLTFVKLRGPLDPEETARARETGKEALAKREFGIIMVERGIGLGYDGVVVALYEDYGAYLKHRDNLKSFPFLELSDIDSFVINLDDDVHYRPLTLSLLANLLPKNDGKKKDKK
jgi:DNA-binding Lrp family transcriptional regulator